MTKDLNQVLFWGPKWPGNGAYEVDIQHTSKSSSNWHANQDWCETSGNVWRKCPKTGSFTYFGTQSCPKIGLLRLIFSTHLKVFAMNMWSNTDVKYWKRFEKMTKDLHFDLFWGPKWPQNWPLKPILHTPLNELANEHIKQYWCEISENFF